MARLLYRLETESGLGPWVNCHENTEARSPEGFVYATHSLESIKWWLELDRPQKLDWCKVSVYRAKKFVNFPRVKTDGYTTLEDLPQEELKDTLRTREVWMDRTKCELVARIPLDRL